HIVNSETGQRCEPDTVGEIWVSGPNVAQGYWSRPELSAHTFQAKLAGEAADQLFLRTGDLGFMRGGELFVTGRLKDLLIIRGRNHYPHDIEWVVEQAHIAIQPSCVAAVLLGEEHEAKLAITAEIKRSLRYNLNHEEVVQAIREAVAREHQLEVAAVALLNPTQTPRTSSGKIQRYLCRDIFTTNSPEPLFLWRKAERPLASADEPAQENDNRLTPQQLLHELREEFALFLNVEPEEIDNSKPLYAFGLGSIGAIALQTHLETTYDLKIPVNMFFDDLCLDEIVVEIMQLLPEPETDEDW
ncbi:MAG: AMP-binding protein, partial [Symploca sp. SIO1C4]|nr:AMP-binding protein [Symploca sp. SIO1C4]